MSSLSLSLSLPFVPPSPLSCSPLSLLPAVHSPSHQIQQLRLVKSDSELALMRRAADIACNAFTQVRHCSHTDSFSLEPLSSPVSSHTQAMRATAPGVNEYQLESVFEHSVKMAGAQRMSFPPVVAGGPRATCLHYITNNRDLQ